MDLVPHTVDMISRSRDQCLDSLAHWPLPIRPPFGQGGLNYCRWLYITQLEHSRGKQRMKGARGGSGRVDRVPTRNCAIVTPAIHGSQDKERVCNSVSVCICTFAMRGIDLANIHTYTYLLLPTGLLFV